MAHYEAPAATLDELQQAAAAMREPAEDPPLTLDDVRQAMEMLREARARRLDDVDVRGLFYYRRLAAMPTVGEALSRSPIGTVVEYSGAHDGPEFRQTRVDRSGNVFQSRWWVYNLADDRGRWSQWRDMRDGAMKGGVDGADIRKPCRIVVDFESDPTPRGAIPRSFLVAP